MRDDDFAAAAAKARSRPNLIDGVAIQTVAGVKVSAMRAHDNQTLVQIDGRPVNVSMFLTDEQFTALMDCWKAVQPTPDFVSDPDLTRGPQGSPMLIDQLTRSIDLVA